MIIFPKHFSELLSQLEKINEALSAISSTDWLSILSFFSGPIISFLIVRHTFKLDKQLSDRERTLQDNRNILNKVNESILVDIEKLQRKFVNLRSSISLFHSEVGAYLTYKTDYDEASNLLKYSSPELSRDYDIRNEKLSKALNSLRINLIEYSQDLKSHANVVSRVCIFFENDSDLYKSFKKYEDLISHQSQKMIILSNDTVASQLFKEKLAELHQNTKINSAFLPEEITNLLNEILEKIATIKYKEID